MTLHKYTFDLNGIDSYIFDCDGVVFNSNKLKSEAFLDVLESFGYDEAVKSDFIHYHQSNGGVSRYVKFEYLIRNILREEFNKDLYQNLLKEYSLRCVALYSKAGFVPGIETFIKKVKVPMSIASGSDEEELRTVFINRDVSNYFSFILGAPKTKSQCVSEILMHQKGKRTVLFGDSYSDFAAAKEFGCEFIFVSQYSEAREKMENVCQENKCPAIYNFEELL